MPRKDRAFGEWHSSKQTGGSGRRKVRVKTVGKRIRSSYRQKQNRA